MYSSVPRSTTVPVSPRSYILVEVSPCLSLLFCVARMSLAHRPNDESFLKLKNTAGTSPHCADHHKTHARVSMYVSSRVLFVACAPADWTDGIDAGRFFAAAVLRQSQDLAKQHTARTVGLHQARNLKFISFFFCFCHRGFHEGLRGLPEGGRGGGGGYCIANRCVPKLKFARVANEVQQFVGFIQSPSLRVT